MVYNIKTAMQKWVSTFNICCICVCLLGRVMIVYMYSRFVNGASMYGLAVVGRL